ncbi:MAG: methionyl-tRNA formyltransferase [Acidimicrobiia bacterium]
MRLVFLGSPSDAVPMLEALVGAGHEVALVVTQPDRRHRRRAEPEPTPVREAAETLGLPVLTPQRSAEIVDDVASSGATLGVAVAFGQLLPPDLLDALPNGYVNVHFSLLPAWRGAAPVERALLAGDTETGVSLMRIEAGLDSGPVYARATTPIGRTDTAGDLHERLVELGTGLLLDNLGSVPGATPEPQTGEASYADKLTTAEFELDWSRPAAVLDRWVRAGNPRPGAWTTDRGSRLKIWCASVVDDRSPGEPGVLRPDGTVVTGDGLLALHEVQPQDRRVMDASAWLAGRRSRAEQLGT